jgi:hypothetical protein
MSIMERSMNRSPVVLLIGVALAVYGVYAASYALPLLMVGTTVPLILLGFLVQAVAAIAAAVGVFRGSSWTAFAVIVLGVAIAATAFVEGFVLGLVAADRALLVAVAGLVVAFLVAAVVRRPQLASA